MSWTFISRICAPSKRGKTNLAKRMKCSLWTKVHCKWWTIIIFKKKNVLCGDGIDSFWNKCWTYYFKWLTEKILSNLGNHYFTKIEKKVKPNGTMNKSFWIKQVSKVNLRRSHRFLTNELLDSFTVLAAYFFYLYIWKGARSTLKINRCFQRWLILSL